MTFSWLHCAVLGWTLCETGCDRGYHGGEGVVNAHFPLMLAMQPGNGHSCAPAWDVRWSASFLRFETIPAMFGKVKASVFMSGHSSFSLRYVFPSLCELSTCALLQSFMMSMLCSHWNHEQIKLNLFWYCVQQQKCLLIHRGSCAYMPWQEKHSDNWG